MVLHAPVLDEVAVRAGPQNPLPDGVDDRGDGRVVAVMDNGCPIGVDGHLAVRDGVRSGIFVGVLGRHVDDRAEGEEGVSRTPSATTL